MRVLSSCVFNMSNYIIRQEIMNNKKVSNFHNIQKALQKSEDYQLLGRSYSLPMLQKHSELVSSRFKLLKSKSQRKVGLPKYYKNRKTNTTLPSYLVIDGDQINVGQRFVRIPLSHEMRKKYSLRNFKIRYNGVLRYEGKTCRSEIHYKEGHYYLHQSVEFDDVPKQEVKSSMGVDLGVKRLISYYTEQGKSLTIGSQRWFRQWQHYNVLISKEQSYLTKLNRRTSNKLSRLYRRRSKWQKQLFDNVVAKLFKHIRKHNIQRVFVGDVTGIRNNDSKGKVVNSMINNYWSYDKLFHKIDSKAEENGVLLEHITEEYTTRTCPVCGHEDRKNVKDRQFSCKSCGFQADRDVVGARNILTKGMCSPLQNAHRQEILPFGVSI